MHERADDEHKPERGEHAHPNGLAAVEQQHDKIEHERDGQQIKSVPHQPARKAAHPAHEPRVDAEQAEHRQNGKHKADDRADLAVHGAHVGDRVRLFRRLRAAARRAAG